MGRISRLALQNKTDPKKIDRNRVEQYETFDQLDGRHDWQNAVPDGCALYKVRKLHQGKTVYFNFDLAKEMGLIDKDHPHIINDALEKKIIETFSIRIINEYDQKQNIFYHPTVVKPHAHMATRYLQLQHKNKKGKTSGDGRSIWNGQVKYKNAIWDVSSRGTGVTKLSPGAVEAHKPLRSGSTKYGYGCGFADIDELVGAAIQAEILHKKNFKTERVLTIINFGDGNGIGVRASKNLFRPAHLFSFLKQGDYNNLKNAVDYLIQRQIHNGEWNFSISEKNKYELMLKNIALNFSSFTSRLERNFIFAWLDWDGDNVLFDSGIIDYGSVRQFGLRHDKYVYDDVDRFSTNLNQQKYKAQYIVQNFAQMIDFLQTGRKKNITKYKNHWSVKLYKSNFEKQLLNEFLIQVGLTQKQATTILKSHTRFIKNLYKDFVRLESAKTKAKPKRVADGINSSAIYNMRNVLLNIPELYLNTAVGTKLKPIPLKLFSSLLIAKSTRGKDKIIKPQIKRTISSFQKNYLRLVQLLSASRPKTDILRSIQDNSLIINRPDRLTGDGLLCIVDKLLKFAKRHKNKNALQVPISWLIEQQSSPFYSLNYKLPIKQKYHKIIDAIQELISDTSESI